MGSGGCTHLLFDFFGTLVEYSPSRTEQGYRRTHAILQDLGAAVSYQEFLSAWSRVSAQFDEQSDLDDREYSMTEVSGAFLGQALGRPAAVAEIDALTASYLQEWNSGVRYLPGIAALVRSLAGEYRLAVVTNTHQPDLVPGHLAAMGVESHFDAVVTSVEVGWRKPHPAIFSAALGALGARPEQALFIGDSYVPDVLGPQRAGIPAVMIDPEARSLTPGERRLASVFGLPSWLATRAASP